MSDRSQAAGSSTYRLSYSALVDLVHASFTTHSGYTRLPTAAVTTEQSIRAVFHLRRFIADALSESFSRALVSGTGPYRLAVSCAQIAATEGFFEVAKDVIPKELLDELRQLLPIVQEIDS